MYLVQLLIDSWSNSSYVTFMWGSYKVLIRSVDDPHSGPMVIKVIAAINVGVFALW
jgi:hypothetical protein